MSITEERPAEVEPEPDAQEIHVVCCFEYDKTFCGLGCEFTPESPAKIGTIGDVTCSMCRLMGEEMLQTKVCPVRKRKCAGL